MREIEKITSRDNRRLVYARKVRDGGVPEKIFIEGKRLAAEAVRSGITIDECFVVEGFRDRELRRSVEGRTANIAEVSEKSFHTVADTIQPQGIVLIARRPRGLPEGIEGRLGRSVLPLVVFLNEINNPSNLGAVLRTAEAAGVAGVVVSQNSADVFSPKALRASMGASFRIAIWENAHFEEAMNWANAMNLIVTAADVSASVIYLDTDWQVPRLLLFGSEAHGLSKSELFSSEDRVRIPLDNHVESLNLAVSAGIILFEARRQNWRCPGNLI